MLDDAEAARLLERVRAGSPDVSGLYRAYANLVRAEARHVLGSSDLVDAGSSADDVVEVVFKEIMQGRLLRPDTLSVPAMLMIAARRRAIDLLRKRRPGSLPKPRDGAEDPGEQEAGYEDVEERVALVQLKTSMERRLDVLNERERRVYEALFKEHRPVGEVAEHMTITPTRVRQIGTDALDKLLKAIGYGGVDDDAVNLRYQLKKVRRIGVDRDGEEADER